MIFFNMEVFWEKLIFSIKYPTPRIVSQSIQLAKVTLKTQYFQA